MSQGSISETVKDVEDINEKILFEKSHSSTNTSSGEIIYPSDSEGEPDYNNSDNWSDSEEISGEVCPASEPTPAPIVVAEPYYSYTPYTAYTPLSHIYTQANRRRYPPTDDFNFSSKIGVIVCYSFTIAGFIYMLILSKEASHTNSRNNFGVAVGMMGLLVLLCTLVFAYMVYNQCILWQYDEICCFTPWCNQKRHKVIDQLKKLKKITKMKICSCKKRNTDEDVCCSNNMSENKDKNTDQDTDQVESLV